MGSEMCIRDRGGTQGRARAAQPAPGSQLHDANEDDERAETSGALQRRERAAAGGDRAQRADVF